jgi:hypothetical protein
MALPASGPISSSMIAAEFSSSQAPSGPNISLGGLGTKLSSAVTYGQPISSSVFYGQSLPVSLTSFSYNRNAQEEYEEACALESTEDVAYHNGSDSSGYPVANDSVFRNSTGTTAVANGTYKMANNKAMTIDGGSGVVSEINDCE